MAGPEDTKDNKIQQRIKALGASVFIGASSLLGTAAQAQTSAPSDATPTAATIELEDMARSYEGRQGGGLDIVTLHPDQISAMEGLGASRFESVNAIANSQGVTLPEKASADFSEVSASDEMSFIPSALMGRPEYATYNAQAPMAQQLPEIRACIVMGGNSSHSGLPIGTFDLDTQNRFFNRHEFWHCLDDRFISQTDTASTTRGVSDASHQFTMQMRGEIFADLAAVTDMIVQDGEDTSFIDALVKARDMRLGGNMDFTHHSSPALNALKDHIEKVGMERFIAMNDKDRIEMLYEMTAKNSPSPKQTEILYTKKESEIAKRAKKNPDYAAANAKYNQYNTARDEYNSGWVVTDDMMEVQNARKALVDQAKDWEAEKKLRENAEQLPGGLTPQNLQQARNTMLDSVREDMKNDPSNPLHAAKLAQIGMAYSRIAGEVKSTPTVTISAPSPTVG